MRILFIGDTHSDTKAPALAESYASMEKADAIFQLGDFGHGFGPTADTFLKSVVASVDSMGIPWYFIDGNHDNHDDLWNIYKGGDPVESPLYPGVTYCPRGSVLELPNGIKVGCLGGAVSMDKYHRIAGRDWWATEEQTLLELNVAADKWSTQRPEIIVTHDAPTCFPVLRNEEHYGFDETNHPMMAAARSHRQRMQILLDNLFYVPAYWLHGHFHQRYEKTFPIGLCAVGCGRFDTYDGIPKLKDTFMLDTDLLLS